MGQEKATEERDQICLVHRTENCQCFKSTAINKTLMTFINSAFFH